MSKLGVCLMMALMVGCSGPNGPTPTPPTPAGQAGPVQELRFARTGGGQLEFTLTKETGTYAIRVTQTDFRAVDAKFELKRSRLQLQDAQVLDDVFDGKVSLDPGPDARQDNSPLPTGTWVAVKARQADRIRDVTNVAVIAAMQSIEVEVRSQLEQQSPPAAKSP